jgi:hypothetical protein
MVVVERRKHEHSYRPLPPDAPRPLTDVGVDVVNGTALGSHRKEDW